LKDRNINLLKEEAKKVHPTEACAILIGRTNPNELIVSEVLLTPNKLQSSVRFEIDPEFLFQTFEEVEKKGCEVIGFFHSHPAPTKPSRIDKKFMKHWSNKVWLILSSITSEIAAYMLVNEEVREIHITIEKNK
jgi:proteasome lid subunit RPN8/RPN11